MAKNHRAASARTAPAKKRSKLWWIIVAIIGTIVAGSLIGRFSPILTALVIAAVVALGVAAFAGHPIRWLGMRSRLSGFSALGVAALLVMSAGASGATETVIPEAAAPAAFAPLPAQEDNPPAPPRPEPEPSPTPTTSTVTEESPIDFERTTIDDPDRDEGERTVITAGVAGVLETTYVVTALNGEELSRQQVRERVAVEPIDEVTAIGTRVAAAAPVPLVPQQQAAPAPKPKADPEQKPKAAPAPKCDPNYTGACVPIASDVDCAGGNGNGPAYVEGPVRIIGKDIYKLDHDGDGIACD